MWPLLQTNRATDSALGCPHRQDPRPPASHLPRGKRRCSADWVTGARVCGHLTLHCPDARPSPLASDSILPRLSHQVRAGGRRGMPHIRSPGSGGQALGPLWTGRLPGPQGPTFLHPGQHPGHPAAPDPDRQTHARRSTVHWEPGREHPRRPGLRSQGGPRTQVRTGQVGELR